MSALICGLLAVFTVFFSLFVFQLDAALRRARRDYLAAQALSGFMARPGGIDPKLDADLAYRLADAMLAARASTKGGA